MQNRRYLAGVRRIRRASLGAIGAMTSIHCDFFLAPHFGGFRDEMDHVLLLDMAIHAFDAAARHDGARGARRLLPRMEPAELVVRQGSSAVAIFDMRAGRSSSTAAAGAPTGADVLGMPWRFVGEHGSLTWDGSDVQLEVLDAAMREGLFEPRRRSSPPPLRRTIAIGGHLGVMQDFVAAVRGGPRPETVSTDNIRTA